MPEYLAPGVYVEETSFRPKSIEGVSTSTAGFVGPTRFGPTKGEPPLLTSFADFERIYGGLKDLRFESNGSTESAKNFLAYGVRAFFEEGGQRCYVSRVVTDDAAEADGTISPDSSSPISDAIRLEARFPGLRGEVKVTFTPALSGDVVKVDDDGEPKLSGVRDKDTVFVVPESGSQISEPGFYDLVVDKNEDKKLRSADGTEEHKTTVLNRSGSSTPNRDAVYRVMVEISVQIPEERFSDGGVVYGAPESIGEFTLRPDSRQSFTDYLAEEPPSDQVRYSAPFYVDPSQVTEDLGATYAEILFTRDGGSEWSLDNLTEKSTTLTDASDGARPAAGEYEGTDGSPGADEQRGLGALQDLDEVSIVLAPGYTADGVNNPQAIQSELISHCERLQYRIAVLDTPSGSGIGRVRNWRGQIDSSHAAMYHPWITIFDPVTRSEINVPPSGYVAGIYARNDVENGVQKAPANEVVRSAVGLEFRINKAQQDVLNPDGINCIRFFEGRGYRLWGARTTTSDPEFKYVNVRRYLAYLERSIDEGTQMFVFENNGPDLWRNVERTVGSFLRNEWRSDRLLGTTREEAYFVRCDRSTMTQNDIDNGRLICEVGVSLLKPAEFVIFRVGQKLMETRG